MDRFDYSTAIADSWKQQTLLNIVKLRYMDLPVFVDVASIVSGYSLQTGVNVGGTSPPKGGAGRLRCRSGGQAIYTDRPTITYVPLTGEKFLRGLITPIDPKNIFFMLQSGYAADFILGLTVESLNGVRNRSATGGRCGRRTRSSSARWSCCAKCRPPAPSGCAWRRTRPRARPPWCFSGATTCPPTSWRRRRRSGGCSSCPPDQQRFVLTYSPVRGADGRTGREQPLDAADHGRVRELHGRAGGAPARSTARCPAFENAAPERPAGAVRIHSGKEKPADAFAAVRYRDYWFWIDDGDWQTKRALTAVMFFFTLAETGGNEKLPLDHHPGAVDGGARCRRAGLDVRYVEPRGVRAEMQLPSDLPAIPGGRRTGTDDETDLGNEATVGRGRLSPQRASDPTP